MPSHRPPIISNRFEIVILILMCFAISTRLVWLQIDDRNRTITDEFYATSLLFNTIDRTACPIPPDPLFPVNGAISTNFLDGGALTSPGLRLAFIGFCQFNRLSLNSFLEYAPLLIGLSTFLTALTARILTSNWVGGMLAATVVLSRGTILQGTHVAGAFWFVQLLTSLVFFFLALSSRSRRPSLLVPFILSGFMCTYMSPLMGIVLWSLTGMLVLRLMWQRLKEFAKPRVLAHQLLLLLASLVILPLMIYHLHRVEPSSTQSIILFATQMRHLLRDWKQLLPLLGSAIAIFEQQDFHWLLSFAVIGLAGTWKRFLPRGSGFAALAITSCCVIALLIDGAITAQATAQINPVNFRRYYSMTDAVFAMEPVILGAAASYAWFAVRYVIIRIFPSYISASRERDGVK